MMSLNKHRKIFGQTLKRIRLEAGRTQEELAFDADLDRTYIGLLENGRNSPTLDTIVAISHALKINPASLLADIK